MIVGNRDKCGRCGTRHGGNSRLCPVHGPVGEHCCGPTGCNPDEWERNLYDLVKGQQVGGYYPCSWVFNRTLGPREIPSVGVVDSYSIRWERKVVVETGKNV